MPAAPGFTPASTDLDDPSFFSSSHGLVQTHPAAFGDQENPAERPYVPASSLDFDTRGLNELRNNPLLSSPEECARACREGEPPKICYYHLTMELYTVLGAWVCLTRSVEKVLEKLINTDILNIDAEIACCNRDWTDELQGMAETTTSVPGISRFSSYEC